MANIIADATIVKTSHKSGFIFSLSSDGTAELNLKKIILANLPGAPKKVSITRLSWAMSDNMQIGIRFDRPALPLQKIILNSVNTLGHGSMPLEDAGLITDGTGDIQFTSFGMTIGKGYTIEIEVQATK